LDGEGVIGNSSHSTLKLKFVGSRVDAIAAHVKGLSATGTARVLIDGKPPSTDPHIYAITLPSKGPGTWFPAIRRIDSEKLPLLEDWTLRIPRSMRTPPNYDSKWSDQRSARTAPAPTRSDSFPNQAAL
jgi:hypothetical protein